MMYLRYSKVRHGLLIDAEDSVSERKMTKQRNREAKKLEVNLNYLRNDLDIWQHRVQSWLHAKSKPQQNEIDKFGIEVVQKLCTRKVLNIYGMKFPELPLTPRRSRSVSPNRPTTPESASRRSKSITRDSPKDRHHDCQKKLDLDDDEDGYKVDAYTNPATCTCAHDETFYKCRLSLLEKQKIELEKEIRRLESLATDYTAKFRYLKNMMDRKMDACHDCEMKEQHMQRYKAERNKLKIDRQRLEKLLTNLAGERNDLAQKLQKIVFDNAKLEDKNQNLESHEEEQKIALKDANDALQQQIHMLEICREEKNEAESTLSDYLMKHDDQQLQCEKAQLQTILKKQKQKADEQIHHLKQNLKEKEKDLQQGTERLNEINEKLKEMEIQGQDMSSRDRNELLHEQKNNRKLVEDNESLREKIYEIENNYAETMKQHIDIESKFQHQICNLKIQTGRADKKVTNAERELEEMRKKCLEQRLSFNSKQCQFEKEIKELRLELDKVRKATDNRCSSSVGGGSDTKKENISLRSELTEALKSLEKLRQEHNDLTEKDTFSKAETSKLLKDNEGLKDNLQNLSKQLNELENRVVLSNEETSKLIKDNTELKDNLKNLLKQLKESENRVMLSKEETSKLQIHNVELKDNLQNLSKQLKESENRVMLSKEETSKLQIHNVELKDNLQNLSKQLKESENRDMLSKEKTSKLIKDNAELKDNLQNLSKQLEELENRVMLSKEETSKLQIHNVELKDNLQNVSKQLKESENRDMLSKVETSKLIKDNAELKENLQNLSKQLEELENRVMLSKEETSKLQKHNAELKDNLQNLSKQLKESENSYIYIKAYIFQEI